MGSNNSNEGRIEVLFKAEWGTVCDDGWTMNSTEVVCRQLGFPGAIKTQKFGPGTGLILFDDVRCTGEETALLYCPHNGFGVHNCFHGEDVGVVCQRTSVCMHFMLFACTTCCLYVINVTCMYCCACLCMSLDRDDMSYYKGCQVQSKTCDSECVQTV